MLIVLKGVAPLLERAQGSQKWSAKIIIIKMLIVIAECTSSCVMGAANAINTSTIDYSLLLGT